MTKNQEMSIDTSLIDLDNLASENDKETNEVEMDDSSTNSEKEEEHKIILATKNINIIRKNMMR